MAEAAFNRGFGDPPFRHYSQEANTTVSLTEYTNLPADFLELSGIKTTSAPIVKLQYITTEAGDLKYTSGSTGTPKYFTIEAGQIRVFPSPSAGLSIKITYAQKIGPLSGGVNWLLTNHPDVYLFGSLLHGAVYAHDDPRLQTVIAGYNAAISGLRKSSDRTRYGGGVLQTFAA